MRLQAVLLGITALALAPRGAGAYQPGHMYVSQSVVFGGGVYRFPLDSNGLPRREPDGYLTTPANPGGIAIGPDGDLYVAEETTHQSGRGCAIEVFAPGATGAAKPLRVLHMPEDSPCASVIAVDNHGYLVVYGFVNGSLYVYKPNARGHEKPFEQAAFNSPFSLAVDGGRVYATSLKVFGPSSNFESVAEFPLGQGPLTYAESGGGYGIAVDASGLYVLSSFGPYGHHSLDSLSVDVFAVGGSGRTRSIISSTCTGDGGPNGSGISGAGLAVYAGHVFMGCGTPFKRGGGVQVYDANANGFQKPIATVPVNSLDLKIGP
jgi:hypothetical protein